MAKFARMHVRWWPSSSICPRFAGDLEAAADPVSIYVLPHGH